MQVVDQTPSGSNWPRHCLPHFSHCSPVFRPKVALQFPDTLLPDAGATVTALREGREKDLQVFVLADTSYGSCCVDEVAAEHVNADLIIHYGPSCLSLYVVGATQFAAPFVVPLKTDPFFLGSRTGVKGKGGGLHGHLPATHTTAPQP